MAIGLGKAYVQIVPSAKGISGGITNQVVPAADAAGRTGGLTLGKKLAAVASAAIAAAGIGKAIAASIEEGGKLQQSIGGVETLFKSSAGMVKKYAQEAYRTTGVSANSYMENVTSFAASLVSSCGGNTKKAAKLANTAMTDMGDNANKMGTDMELVQETYQSLARGNYEMLDNLKLGYGGTKSEMERLMKDAEKLTGEHYTVGDFGDTVKAIHAVQEHLKITGTTAKEASTTLQGSFNSMKASFQDVLGNLSDGELDITPSLNALATTTSNFLFNNFLPMVGRVFKNLPGAIGTFIQAAAPNVKKGIQGLFSNLGIKIDFSSITSSFSKITSAIQPVVNTIKNSFSHLNFSGLQSLANAILPAVSAGFSSFVSVAGPAVSGVVKSFASLWNAAQPLVSVIAGALKPAFQVLGAFLGGVFKGVLSTIKFAFDALKVVIQVITPIIQVIVNVFKAFSPVITMLASFIGQLIGQFGGLGGAAKTMKNVVSTAWNGIKDGVKLAGEGVKGVVNGLKIAWNSLKSAGNALRSAVSGAWHGLGSVVSSVSGGVRGAVSGAKAAFSAFGRGVSNVSGGVKGVLGGVRSAFNGLRNINLWHAGAAIMNGLLSGLKSAWGSVKHFVGGIAKWIKKHKGPISYDKKLLIPAGNAIMAGLNGGLVNGFENVKSTVLDMSGTIADTLTANPTAALATSGNVAPGMTTASATPVVINLTLGNSDFSAFVDDISKAQGTKTQFQRNYKF
jgi:phage-related protein